MDISIKDHISLSVGTGSNNFKMSRGSFSYKEDIDRRSSLSKTGERKSDKGYILEFKDKRSGEMHYLSVSDTDGLLRISYCDENGTVLGQETETLSNVYYDTDYDISFGHYTSYKKLNLDHVNVEIIKSGKTIDNFTAKVDKNKISYLN